MIKVLRFANEKYPWFLAITMGFIAITFIVGMGWWGFGEQSGSVVATVGELSISTDEFKRAYENTYRFYKEKYPESSRTKQSSNTWSSSWWTTACG